jgi:hypothetical protein
MVVGGCVKDAEWRCVERLGDAPLWKYDMMSFCGVIDHHVMGYCRLYAGNKECNEKSYKNYSNSKCCITSLTLWNAQLVEWSVATSDEFRPALRESLEP